MTYTATKIHLNIRITKTQLGYISYLYPDEDPEETLVKLLEGDRPPAALESRTKG
jgi:hypothetical protein